MRVLIATVVLATVALSGQTPNRPDFSGTWVVEKQGEPAKGATPEKHVVFQQTQTELVIEGTGWPGKLVYNLKGIETAVMPTDERTTSKAKAHWEGATLIVETVRTIRSSKSDTTNTYHFTDSFRLDPSGRLLFERLTKTARGESVAKVVYRKIGP
jgi:hypothetical protein